MTKIKVLVATAEPEKATPIKPERFKKYIDFNIKNDGYADSFSFHWLFASSKEEFFKAIESFKPDILHLYGHGDQLSEFYFEKADGKQEPISPNNFSKNIKFHSGHVKCVIFSMCHSDVIAKETSKYINYAIGNEGSIAIEAAKLFSNWFYFYLANNHSFPEAVEMTQAKLAMENFSVIPNLFIKPDVTTHELLIKPGTKFDENGEPDFENMPTVSTGIDYFTGRRKEFDKLNSLLKNGNYLLILQGIGGAGKTTFALKYYGDSKSIYKKRAWITVHNNLQTSFTEQFSNSWHFSFETTLTTVERFDKIIEKLKSFPGDNLLIIDNANNETELLQCKQALKSLDNWHILITTRANPDNFMKIQIDILEPNEAVKLFSFYRKDDENFDWKEQKIDLLLLLERVKFHTLVIELLAKAGKANNLSIKHFCKLIEEADFRHPDLQKKELEIGINAESKMLARQAVLENYIDSLFEPENLSETKQKILLHFSLFPSSYIDETKIKHLLSFLEIEELENELIQLNQFGWLDRSESEDGDNVVIFFRMHPLMQNVVFKRLEAESNSGNFIFFLTLIHKENETLASYFTEFAETVLNKIKTPTPELAKLSFYLSDIYYKLGWWELAMNALGKCLFAYKSLEDVQKIAATYSRLGNLFKSMGHFDKALEFFTEFDNHLKEFYEANPKSENLKNWLAISCSQLGDIYQALGETDKALEFFTKYHDISKELFEANPKIESLKYGMAVSYEKLGEIYQVLGKMDKALESFTKYHDISKELFEANPKSESLKYGMAVSYSKLGEIYQALGKTYKALEFFTKDIDISKELFQANPKSESLKYGLAVSYSKLGEIYQALGETDKALEFFTLRSQLGKELYDANPKSESLKVGLAVSYEKLGEIYQALGKTDKALEFFTKYHDTSKELFESNPKSERLKDGLAVSYEKLGEIYQVLGKMDKALEFFTLRSQLGKELYDANPKSERLKDGLAISYEKLGEIYQASGEIDKALEFFAYATRLFKELIEANPKNIYLLVGLAISYKNIAEAYKVIEDHKNGEKYFSEYKRIVETLVTKCPQIQKYKEWKEVKY